MQDLYGMVGLEQLSPNLLSMRLIQVVNNIKVSLKSIFKKYLQDTIVYLVSSEYV